MAETCISRNVHIASGVISIEPWSVPHHVLDQTFASTGDGTFTVQTTLPGKLMIDSGVLTWTNPSPLDARLLLRVQRSRRDWQVSSPNAVQIRDRWIYTIGGATPRTPDTSSVYNGQSGASLDMGTAFNATPYEGVYYEWEDPTLSEDWIGPIPSGEDFKIWYRAYLWTPPPWSNNANNNNPLHSAHIFGTRIQLMAFPVQDPDVVA